MVILHVAYLNNIKAKGPNINVPKNIIYGNLHENVGLYNICQSELAISIPDDKNFSIAQYESIESLPEPFNKPDIVIFQGLYYIKYCAMARKLIKQGIPYIIVPRCSMTWAAVHSKFLKKKIANILFFNRFVKHAKSIQFLTQNEYEESKKVFKFQDYYILGNGVEIPNTYYKVKDRKEFKLVFIARYNIYHKGLDLLLEAVNNNIGWFRENFVTLNLYGNDSDNGLAFLKNYISKNGIDDVVKLNGPAFDKEKEKVLLDSDIFIHTSRLEGQPTAVIEAISYGIPVIVTPGTNLFDVVSKYNLGFTTEFGCDEIFNCIKNSFENRKDFKMISKNELDYAKSNFDWEEIIKISIEKYK